MRWNKNWAHFLSDVFSYHIRVMLVYHHVNCRNGGVKQEERREGAQKIRTASRCMLNVGNRSQAFACIFNVLMVRKKKWTRNRMIVICQTHLHWQHLLWTNGRTLANQCFSVDCFFHFWVVCRASRLRETHAYNIRSCDTFELVSYDRLTSAQD